MKQDFETEYTMRASGFERYQAKTETDPGVYSGEYSLHRSSREGTNVVNFSDNSFRMTVGQAYILSMAVRVVAPEVFPEVGNQTPITVYELPSLDPWDCTRPVSGKTAHPVLTAWTGMNGFDTWKVITLEFVATCPQNFRRRILHCMPNGATAPCGIPMRMKRRFGVPNSWSADWKFFLRITETRLFRISFI